DMRRIAPEPRIVVEQARRHEIDFAAGVGMRRGAPACRAEARRPAVAFRHHEAGDLGLAAQPAETTHRSVEDGIAVGPRHLAAFRAMALPGRADLSLDRERHRPAQARSGDWLGHGTLL